MPLSWGGDMEGLDHINTVMQILAALSATLAAIVTAVVQLRKLPAGWHRGLLFWVAILCMPAFAILGSIALLHERPSWAAIFYTASWVIQATIFVRDSHPINRTSVFYFVAGSVVYALVLPTILLGSIIGDVVDNQFRQTEIISRIIGLSKP
jgi:hypothetical protein